MEASSLGSPASSAWWGASFAGAMVRRTLPRPARGSNRRLRALVELIAVGRCSGSPAEQVDTVRTSASAARHASSPCASYPGCASSKTSSRASPATAVQKSHHRFVWSVRTRPAHRIRAVAAARRSTLVPAGETDVRTARRLAQPATAAATDRDRSTKARGRRVATASGSRQARVPAELDHPGRRNGSRTRHRRSRRAAPRLHSLAIESVFSDLKGRIELEPGTLAKTYAAATRPPDRAAPARASILGILLEHPRFGRPARALAAYDGRYSHQASSPRSVGRGHGGGRNRTRVSFPRQLRRAPGDQRRSERESSASPPRRGHEKQGARSNVALLACWSGDQVALRPYSGRGGNDDHLA